MRFVLVALLSLLIPRYAICSDEEEIKINSVHTKVPLKTSLDPSIRIDLLDSWNGREPLTVYSIRLTLINRQWSAVWFVLPHSGSKPLRENGIFTNEDQERQPFGGIEHLGEGGSIIEISMYGGEGFKAFHIPANGRVEFNDYRLYAPKGLSQIVILEADELMVNGVTPLQKWLPYNTISHRRVTVTSTGAIGEMINLDWDTNKMESRGDYPDECIDSVKAKSIRRWFVKVQEK